MKLNDIKMLYICNDFPYPPMHGGLVDMWNRIQTLHSIGVKLDVIITAKEEPPIAFRTIVEKQVDHLQIITRRTITSGLLSYKPIQVKIREDLRNSKLWSVYDVVLMQSEFTTEIMNNKNLQCHKSIIRVDNDESAYQIETAKAERGFLRKLYFLQEAVRTKLHSAKMLSRADMLWFVSYDELTRFERKHASRRGKQSLFIPTGIDLKAIGKPSLQGSRVLFVGSLWNPLNRGAIEWYIQNVHPRLNGVREYRLAIVGSTRRKDIEWLRNMTSMFCNIEIHLDCKDISYFYESSALFINPMQKGAGVKLKTIEAALHGLPIVSTKVGADGSGFIAGTHFLRADTPEEFARHIKEFLEDKEVARCFVKRSQEFILEHYDQTKALERALSLI